MDGESDELLVGCITITRVMSADNLLDQVSAEDSEGNELPLAEALGMMRLAEDTLIRARMGEIDDEDDD